MASALLCLSEKLTVLGVDGREPAGLCASRSAFTLLPAASAAVHPRQGTHPRTNSSSTTNQPWPRTLIQIALQLLLPACVAVCSHPEIPGPAYSEAASQIWPTKDLDPGRGQGQISSIKTSPPELHSPWMRAGSAGPKGVWPSSQRCLQTQPDGHSLASAFPRATASASTSRSPSSSLGVLKFPPKEHHLTSPSPPCLGLRFTSTKLSNT